ncbi:LytTR family transcriptional regulator [Polaribacter litorisediminis]|uniref:LytTR family DNA-binding domain-containing protein n=1 Tax=Polaribacter litorisediminis TaxID=1908341 RepID=UPI001CBB2583|nr:LytTR family DNA-binding domain-containing protein [Polaribacter litorisediminis]UAM99412.1 LytTR family transcriptional regulator [Polaribacter litorisediminis]
MHKKYPFDSSIKHHIIIALGLAIWIFIFLYFTEPLDVSEFRDDEKLWFLIGYGFIGGFCYLLFLPFQYIILKKNDAKWTLLSEITFLFTFSFCTIAIARLYYLYIIMANEQNPYDLWYMLKSIYFPAIATILPILIFGRFAFGKYKNKQTEAKKIEIKGEGNYEGVRLFLNDIICVKSSDNYVEVFYRSGNDLKKSLIRNKLSVVADEHPALLRTHRSYLINPFHFEQWKTEKGKLFVVLFHHIEVPVSRTYQNQVKTTLNSTTT